MCARQLDYQKHPAIPFHCGLGNGGSGTDLSHHFLKLFKYNAPRKRTVEPQKVQGESQKRTGPRMAPRENHQETGRTAKTGETDKSGGTQKRKGTSKTSACEGVSCYYLIFVS